MRLDKYLSECGYTRSEAVKIISNGNVIVNNSVMKKKDFKINEFTDNIIVNGKLIKYQKYVYIMMNKPAGVLSATTDKTQKTVIDLLPKELQKSVFPVGRLDKNTTGLLLITNDGEFCHRATSPKHCVEKKYFFKCDDEVTFEDIEKLQNGIELKDGYTTMKCSINMLNNKQGEIAIKEGKYHQIKRMFGAVGNKIIYLKRLSEGYLILDEKICEGEWKYLNQSEIELVTKKD